MDNYEFESIIRALENALDPTTPEMKKAKNAVGQYEYIPYEMNVFMSSVRLADGILKAHGKKASFIDVGCGIGTKLVAADRVLRVDASIHGIEITPEYVDVAKRVVRAGRGGYAREDRFNVICGDALEHDYRPYNLIYFYCPLVDAKKEVALEERIVRTAARGTVFFPNYQFHQCWRGTPLKGVKLKMVSDNMWMKS